MENLTGGTPPVRYLPCVVPCKLYFTQNKELESSAGFFVTRVITPVEDTEGMGIDGLLQSEYYGLQTSYDQKSHKKFLRRQELYLKLIGGSATDGEKTELREITRDLGLLPLSYNSIDFLYDDFLTVYKLSLIHI
mgnify:CR=1 FL=1